jgi:dienelactone hydrolase
MTRSLLWTVLLWLPGVAFAQDPPTGNQPAPDRTAQDALQSELAKIVAVASPVERRVAADALAKRSEWKLDQLRAAMRVFGTFRAETPGRSRVDIPLWTGKALEKTPLHLYVPKGYDPKKPAPLLVIGHWTGGTGDRASPGWIGFAEQTGALLLAPSEAGANGGWAFSIRERESALAAIRYMRLRFNVDESRIWCTGVSRGGHMAWDLALRYPDLFAAIAPMIGGPRIKRVQGQNNIRYVENLVDLPIRDLQGSKDDKYLVANLRLAFKRLKELKARDAKLIEFPKLGHAYDINAVDWVKFFGNARRNPRPERVLRMMATQRETRSFWIEVLEKDKSRVKVVPQIPASAAFNRMDDKGQREYVARAVERRTARLEAKILGKGKFMAKAKYVRKFRILLEPDMFDPKKRVLVRYKARDRRFKVTLSKQVLCREFADRFDRTFLPVAEVVVR